MAKNCCRLCFEEKCRPIGIFTAKGIKLKIGEIIQKHFLDEISENDIFPKFVCVDCWTKLSDFHEFYNGVDEAKSKFLTHTVNEMPNFTEINCDSIALEREFNSNMYEPKIDIMEPAAPACERDTLENGTEIDVEKIDDDSNEISASANDKNYNESDGEGFGAEFGGESGEKLNVNFKPMANFMAELVGGIPECTESEMKPQLHLFPINKSETPEYLCHICIKRFARKAGLVQHVRNVHERSGQVVCHICAKVYSSNVSLRRHLLDHGDISMPPVICEICGSTFKTEQNRAQHMKWHQESSVRCPHCPKISPNRNALKSHIFSVHKKPMLQCPLCDKKFKRTLALTEHVATHTGEYLYSCAYCRQRFKNHSSLYLHYRGVHPNEWSVDRKAKGGREQKADTF